MEGIGAKPKKTYDARRWEVTYDAHRWKVQLLTTKMLHVNTRYGSLSSLTWEAFGTQRVGSETEQTTPRMIYGKRSRSSVQTRSSPPYRNRRPAPCDVDRTGNIGGLGFRTDPAASQMYTLPPGNDDDARMRA